jgi:hypothetical protein
MIIHTRMYVHFAELKHHDNNIAMLLCHVGLALP